MSEYNQDDVTSDKKKIDVNSKKRAALIKIGVAIPTIVTLSSRPAYGVGFCSLSGFASINASGVARHKLEECNGFSQGGWTTAYGNGDGNWVTSGTGCTPNPESEYNDHKNSIVSLIKTSTSQVNNEAHCSRGVWKNNGDETCPNLVQARADYGTTSFDSVFTSGLRNSMKAELISKGWNDSGLTFSLHDALLYGVDPITREAAAAYLNAKATNLPDFHFTPSQVQDLYNVGFTYINGQKVPDSPLNDDEFVTLFQAAQHPA